MKLNLHEIISAISGRKIAGGEAATVTGVSTDTRTLKEGDVYFALKGPRFNGHDFVKDAKAKGAAALVVSEEPAANFDGVPVILVEDTLYALGELARHWRKRFDLPVVAITGSNGKTTTKEMAALVLARKGKVLKTEGNLNNLIGLPLMLFKLDETHRFAILEMGMNAPGEIARLAEIAMPTIGLITNVGRAHLGGFDDLVGVARAKAELFMALNAEATAVINMDDAFVPDMGSKTGEFAGDPPLKAKRFRYGWHPRKNEAEAEDGATPEVLCTAATHGENDMTLRFQVDGTAHHFRLPVFGDHYVYSALATYSLAVSLGLTDAEIQAGFNGYAVPKMRGELIRLNGDIAVIDDTYNANPDSMLMALKNLAKRFPSRRRIAVLGEMFELGAESPHLHEELGRNAVAHGVSCLFAFGEAAGFIQKGFQNGEAFREMGPLLTALKKELKPGDAVLVKGSRGAHMEEVVSFLKNLTP